MATAALAAMVCGCGSTDSLPDDERTRRVDREVRAKYGEGLAELPIDTLVIIGPHNENIRNEFEWAFSLHCALAHGRRVRFDWRNVGGGGSTIHLYLSNVYKRSDSSGIDILWGGGEFNFIPLANEGALQPMTLAPEVLANIPAELGGLPMFDKDLRWVGSAVSAFGFLYNDALLERCRIEPPRRWADLGRERFADLLALADPTQSGSAAAAYRMVACSGKDWPDGWARLLRILANARRFAASAGEAANAPVVGEALVATCIDFYGGIRVAEAPGELVYVSPPGETTFGPDPIAICKNPPHPELAQRFVDFVMSRRGQALWALRVGTPDGPARRALGRQPIRKDFYTDPTYRRAAGRAIVNPYRAGRTMEMTGFRKKVNYNVLRALVAAAAVDNVDGLRAARAKLIETGFDARRLAEFNRLPDNVATLEAIGRTRKALKDETQREEITTGWRRFFRRKYRRIVEHEYD